MTKIHYCLTDVFTHRPFGGNQLAVCLDAEGLKAETMQALAREFNLSETTFLLPAEQTEHTYRVRIFTPGSELPMAGHPSIGTAYILAHKGLIPLTEPETAIVLEEKVGPIPMRISIKDGAIDYIQMQQPLPTFGPYFTDRAAIARLLSIEEADLHPTLPMQAVSCGVPFLYVPVNSLEAIRRVHLRQDVWEQVLQPMEANHIFVFTQEAEQPASTVHCRMFAPAMGIAEDPATGAAHGPLGSYLLSQHLIEPGVDFISEQGFEMGRPSIIHVRIEQEAGRINGVFIGGQCCFIGEGTIELPENA